jgi:hypothetical protein
LRRIDDAAGQFYLQEAYVKFGYRQAELQLGRMRLGFGGAAHGTLALSDAAASLDGIKFSLLPHQIDLVPFRWLGQFSLQVWLAGQGDSFTGHPINLYGLGIASRPVNWLELGLLELNQYSVWGPQLSFSDVLATLAYSGSPELATKRNRAMAFHLDVWMPSRFAKLYTQVFFETLTRFSQWLSDDASSLVGIWFPKVSSFSLRLEYVHTTPHAYQYSLFSQGLTYKNTPLGHPLGPDAEGAYVDVGLPSVDEWRPVLSVFYEARGLHPAFVAATERRYGFGLDAKRRWEKFEIDLSAKYALVKNHFFLPGPDALLFGALATFSYSFD